MLCKRRLYSAVTKNSTAVGKKLSFNLDVLVDLSNLFIQCDGVMDTQIPQDYWEISVIFFVHWWMVSGCFMALKKN